MIYYELLKDGTIGRSSNNEKVARINGYYNAKQIVENEEDIVYGYDNKRYLKGQEPVKPQELINKEKINQLKSKLDDTDYQAIKYAEGELTEEEYAPIKAQRKAWREEINRLEGGLKNGNI